MSSWLGPNEQGYDTRLCTEDHGWIRRDELEGRGEDRTCSAAHRELRAGWSRALQSPEQIRTSRSWGPRSTGARTDQNFARL